MADLPSRIEDYALIGDCLTAALVGRNGSIDWLCWPCFDSDACFAALLGTSDHGRWLIAPHDTVKETKRRYRGETLILETRFQTATGAVTLIDFMPPRGTASDIVRIVRGDAGTVRMRMELVLRFSSGSNVPWVRRLDDETVLAVAGPDMATLRTPVDTHGKDLTTVAEFDVTEGDAVPFVLTYDASNNEVPEALDPQKALAATEEFWSEWSSQNTNDGQYRALVQRSLITLKALTFVPTGGIVAAPTTSLPERFGGARNWDYRYCWIRDATFTLLALINNGYTDEASAWHAWLLRSVAGSPRDMQIMYSITGQRRLLEWEASWLPGYERSRPVRMGNAAHAQLQLDVFGELMDTFHQARKANVKLDEATWALECALLGHLAEAWDRPDAGLWETRGLGEHYVFSKVMCWVAFDRGIKSARQFQMKGAVDTWCAVREEIRADILARGFDARNNTFVEAYGRPYLDASLALLPTLGFIEPDDPRMRGTIEAIERHMMREGFVLRHDPRMKRPGELEPIEGAFLACTLWLADAHILMGNLERAQELFERVVAISNDVGLLAEQYDPISRRQAGNFPQALTHIALINTAANIHNASQPAKQPNVQRSQ